MADRDLRALPADATFLVRLALGTIYRLFIDKFVKLSTMRCDAAHGDRTSRCGGWSQVEGHRAVLRECLARARKVGSKTARAEWPVNQASLTIRTIYMMMAG